MFSYEYWEIFKNTYFKNAFGFTLNKADVKPRFEAWVIFARSGETIESTNQLFDIFISLEIQVRKETVTTFQKKLKQ